MAGFGYLRLGRRLGLGRLVARQVLILAQFARALVQQEGEEYLFQYCSLIKFQMLHRKQHQIRNYHLLLGDQELKGMNWVSTLKQLYLFVLLRYLELMFMQMEDYWFEMALSLYLIKWTTMLQRRLQCWLQLYLMYRQEQILDFKLCLPFMVKGSLELFMEADFMKVQAMQSWCC